MTSPFVVHCKKEAFEIYVGRPSAFGNPFSHKPSAHAEFRVKTRDEAIDRFEAWLKSQPKLVARIRRELRGKILGCHCAPQRCHAEVLAKIANEGAPVEAPPKWDDPRKLGACCDECPRKGRRPVFAQKPSKKLQLIVVGEGPGRMEEREGSPFIGPSGKLLNTIFDEVGFDRDHAFVSNAVLCRGEDYDLPLAMACCAPRLGLELSKLPKDVPILALGSTAVKPTIGRAGIEKSRGFVWTSPEVPDDRLKAAEKVLAKREAAEIKDQDKIVKARAALRVLQGRRLIAGRIVIPSLHPAYLLRGADSSRPLLVTDIDRVVRWSRKPFPLEDEGPYEETNDPVKVRKILARMGPVVELDIESDHADPVTCHIDCIGIGDGELSLVINPWRRSLTPIVNEALDKRTIVAHNGKAFDEIACNRHGIRFRKLEDTLVAHHAFASHMRQSLAHVASVYCDVSNWKVHFHTGAEEKGVAKFGVKAADLSKYNAADLRVGVRVWQRMQPDLASEMSVYRRDMEIAGLCQEMQVVGLRMDIGKRAVLSKQLRARAGGLLGEMRKLTRKKSFNPARLADIRHALFGQFRAPTWLVPPTKTGLPSTAGEMLEALRAQDTRAGSLADLILRWRSSNDTRSEYLDNIELGPDGRVHAGWRAAGPVSGRPATRNPNILNMPRLEMTEEAEGALKRLKDDKAARAEYTARMGEAVYELESLIRSIYVAGEGKMFLYFDLSQAEMRFAAFLSGDPVFMKTCEGDVHVGNACILFPRMADVIRADPKGAGKKYRDIAKNAGFAVSYMAEAETVYAYLRSKGFAISLGDVVAMLERIKAGYTKYYQYVDNNVNFVRRNGYLRTFLVGRITHFGFHPKPTTIANCLDYATEALTPEGWVRGNKLKVGQKLLTKNIATGELVWEPIVRMNRFERYAGKLYQFKSKSFNAVTTPEHRWLVTDRRKGIDRCATSEELAGGSGELSIHRTGHFEGAAGRIYSDDIVELAGWLLTDGSINRRLAVYQTKRKNVSHIDALMKRLRVQVYRAPGDYRRVTWIIGRREPLARFMFDMFPARTLTVAFLHALTTRQLRILLDTMMLGDGSATGSHRGKFSCRDKDRADAFQMLCTLCGIATTVRWTGPSRPKKQYTTIKNRPKSRGIFTVTLLHRTTAQVLRHPRAYGKAKARVDQVRVIKGRPVWCPVVNNSYFVARREGDVFITGNSPIQSGVADIMGERLLEIHAKKPRDVKQVMYAYDAAVYELAPKHLGFMKNLLTETWARPIVVPHNGQSFVQPIDMKEGGRLSDF